MKRRAFLGSSLSAFTVALIDYYPTVAQNLSTGLDKNVLERFVEKFELESSEKYWSDSFFTLLYERTSQNFQKSNYRLPDKQTFLWPALNLVLVPLELKIASFGCIDRGFMFYQQLPDRQWQYVKSINAYEAETILQAFDLLSLQLPTEQMTEYLLPVYSEQYLPKGYTTQKGNLEIEVKIAAAGVQTNIQVWHQQQPLMQQRYHLSEPSPMVWL